MAPARPRRWASVVTWSPGLARTVDSCRDDSGTSLGRVEPCRLVATRSVAHVERCGRWLDRHRSNAATSGGGHRGDLLALGGDALSGSDDGLLAVLHVLCIRAQRGSVEPCQALATADLVQ